MDDGKVKLVFRHSGPQVSKTLPDEVQIQIHDATKFTVERNYSKMHVVLIEKNTSFRYPVHDLFTTLGVEDSFADMLKVSPGGEKRRRPRPVCDSLNEEPETADAGRPRESDVGAILGDKKVVEQPLHFAPASHDEMSSFFKAKVPVASGVGTVESEVGKLVPPKATLSSSCNEPLVGAAGSSQLAIDASFVAEPAKSRFSEADLDLPAPP